MRQEVDPGRALYCWPRPAPPRPAPRDWRIGTGGLRAFLPGQLGQRPHLPQLPPASAWPAPPPPPASQLPRAAGGAAARGRRWPSLDRVHLHSLSGPLSRGRLHRAQSEENSRWKLGLVHITGPPCIVLVPSSSVSVLRFSPQLFTQQSRWG